MKIAFKLLIILILAFVVSCDEKDIPTIPTGKIIINSISPEKIIVFDTVTIKGEYFGYADKGKIILPDKSIIRGENCLLWQFTIIKFAMPKSIDSGEIFIIADKDTSDTLQIEIFPIPNIEVSEIPSGIFNMGSIASSIEMPIHEVEITNELIISKYEVNQRLYETVMMENPSSVEDWNLPVDSISWFDAILFCNALSNIEGLDTCYAITDDKVTWIDSANGWRLPTEAEWEYVCKANTISDFAGTGNLNEMGWYNENSGYNIHPAGLKIANEFDVFDMHGNLWEWCWDYYSSSYYSISPLQDPKGPVSGTRRVLRGGSYQDGKTFARSSNRDIPSDNLTNTGIRIVRYND